ncbi:MULTISPECIES: helix-turn-helix domain-containing protein [Xanthomonas]|uniref:helix-turn-helix domain-containing protein n=1 Tax=Xanthomonas TaxID=338 RepID=UPI001313E0FF|nr:MULTISPECIES: helix-turn-helix domain-containing protein [Xanthomonas]ATS40455.2 helix-turn-helix domain-containing protein [Xanthomonas citri pv. phaseoli var. fuscans]ATS44629.2 helix-turn-helix domain-containing protein [Xanthomonas citri pv. phaseoli var. fuscans]ATS48463.2 helix-turn-helix domain-containing protein [Xanthomonas citri pv. phaseoli var. fuscans]ATS85159.2 helix-turn-helix domain-containing protein [Xanthomonas citri pv. phaseoli var. fuscans]UZA99187.1 helix-turn-helix d
MKLTLLALAEHANPDGSQCFPSIETLAEQTGQNEKTCRRALDAADGTWFTRSPIKLKGRSWRGYNYSLCVPEAAGTVSGPQPEAAGTVSGPSGLSSGHLGCEVRTLTPRGPGAVSDDLGKAPRKSTKEEEPAADAAARALRKGMTFAEWEASIPPGERMIPADHFVERYIVCIGLPYPFAELAWSVFQSRHATNAKRYDDWPNAYLKALEENWYKLWYIDDEDGSYQLTTQGKQADRLYRMGIAA